MPDIAIKLVTQPSPEIIEQVAVLEAEAFGRGGLNEWHLPVVARHGWLYIMECDGRVIAAAGLISDRRAGCAFLFDLAVTANLQGQGYGRRLLLHVIADQRQAGLNRLELTVSPDNVPGVALYDRLGFKVVENYAEEYGPGEDRLLMVLEYYG